MKFDFKRLLEDREISYDENLYIPAIYGEGQYFGFCIKCEWIIRYNDDNNGYEQEPDFIDLDKVLEILAPSITYLHYKQICHDIVEKTDYYNSKTVGLKYVQLDKLYDFLVSKGYLK